MARNNELGQLRRSQLITTHGPGAIVDSDVQIGEGAQIHPYVVLGRNSRVGEHSVLYPGVVFLAQTAGFSVLDITDSRSPRDSVRMHLSGSVLGITLHGDRAYLAAGSLGLLMVDISEPTEPKYLRRFDTEGSDVVHEKRYTLLRNGRAEGVHCADRRIELQELLEFLCTLGDPRVFTGGGEGGRWNESRCFPMEQ